MKLLKITDNSKTLKEDFTKINLLTAKIADKNLKQLEEEGVFVFPESLSAKADLSNDEIIKSVNNFYKSSNVMGFLGLGEERLIIKSRFSKDESDYFFQYLLAKVLELPNMLHLVTDNSLDNQLQNYLIFLFPYYLKKAIRKGLFKEYILKRHNDHNLKGSIDIAYHLKKNIPFTGKIAYSLREFSYDNKLMELVRHTIEYLKNKPYGKTLLASLKEEVQMVTDVTKSYEFYDRAKIIIQNKKNLVSHAYFREYLALQRLCLLILEHRKHQIGIGSRQIYGILFDGSWLWEEYINTLIGDLFYHPLNKARIGAQKLFTDTGKIYPDFISRNKDNRLIGDAKYKPMNNICNKDYLQLLAYMLRFDAKNGFYFYPQKEGEKDRKLYLNSGVTFENNVKARDDIVITKFGLKIPSQASNYEDFYSKILESQSEFRAKVIAYDKKR